MSKLETFNGCQTKWSGVWRNNRSNTYTSSVFRISDLQKFKGPVRLVMIPNRFKKDQSEDAPTHVFMFQSAVIDGDAKELEVEAAEEGEGERYFSETEVRILIKRTIDECHYYWYYSSLGGEDAVIVDDIMPPKRSKK